MKRLQTLIFEDSAASAVEYALLLAGIALVVSASILALGQTVLTKLYNPIVERFPT